MGKMDFSAFGTSDTDYDIEVCDIMELVQEGNVKDLAVLALAAARFRLGLRLMEEEKEACKVV